MRQKCRSLRGWCTGAAWLSSARVVRCWVKSRNERNPRLQLPASRVGHSGGTAGDKPEEGGDDVKSSWPSWAGPHTCYNGGDSGSARPRGRADPETQPPRGRPPARQAPPAPGQPRAVGAAAAAGPAREAEPIPKSRLSSDRALQLGRVKV